MRQREVGEAYEASTSALEAAKGQRLSLRRAIAEASAATDPASVQALRDHAVRLFADLVRHRKRGLDMVYEAYHVDIGGES